MSEALGVTEGNEAGRLLRAGSGVAGRLLALLRGAATSTWKLASSANREMNEVWTGSVWCAPKITRHPRCGSFAISALSLRYISPQCTSNTIEPFGVRNARNCRSILMLLWPCGSQLRILKSRCTVLRFSKICAS